MNSRLNIVTASLAATMLASTAMAADVIEPDPTPPPPEVAQKISPGVAFCVGGQLGYGAADTRLCSGGVTANGYIDGFLGGAFAGYKW